MWATMRRQPAATGAVHLRGPRYAQRISGYVEPGTALSKIARWIFEAPSNGGEGLGIPAHPLATLGRDAPNVFIAACFAAIPLRPPIQYWSPARTDPARRAALAGSRFSGRLPYTYQCY
jgi:hypothetical protein